MRRNKFICLQIFNTTCTLRFQRKIQFKWIFNIEILFPLYFCIAMHRAALNICKHNIILSHLYTHLIRTSTHIHQKRLAWKGRVTHLCVSVYVCQQSSTCRFAHGCCVCYWFQWSISQQQWWLQNRLFICKTPGIIQISSVSGLE